MQDVILIDVPEGADLSKLHIVVSNGDHDLLLKNDHSTNDYLATLPPGSWTIVEQTEEGAAKIVESFGQTKLWWVDYEYPESRMWSALESLHSWIRSMGKEPETTVIVKKEMIWQRTTEK
jgi:hypothetical protein